MRPLPHLLLGSEKVTGANENVVKIDDRCVALERLESINQFVGFTEEACKERVRDSSIKSAKSLAQRS